MHLLGTQQSWPVEHGVPLGAIVYLRQAPQDRIAPIGPGQAAACLIESSEQASISMPHTSAEDIHHHRLQKFETVVDLVKRVDVHTLGISLHSEFWRLLERLLRHRREVVHG